MIREERELLAALMRVNTDVPAFVLAFMGNGLSADDERAFAHRLDDMAAKIRQHAATTQRLVIDGDTLPNTARPTLEPGDRP